MRDLFFLVIIGVSFIVIGVILMVIPFLAKHITLETLKKIPWWVIWIYKRNSFYLVTSPLLIAATLVYIAYILFKLVKAA